MSVTIFTINKTLIYHLIKKNTHFVSVNPVVNNILDFFPCPDEKPEAPRPRVIVHSRPPPYYRAGSPALGFWIQPWYSSPFTHWPLISSQRAWARSFWCSCFCTKHPQVGLLRQTPPTHPTCGLTQLSTLCRKMPERGAKNCSLHSNWVRKLYDVTFSPFQNCKRRQKHA